MAKYPNEIYVPRERENRHGVEYIPEKKSVWFKEDADDIENEIIAVEQELGLNFKTDYTDVKERLEALEAIIGFGSVHVPLADFRIGFDIITPETEPRSCEGWGLPTITWSAESEELILPSGIILPKDYKPGTPVSIGLMAGIPPGGEEGENIKITIILAIAATGEIVEGLEPTQQELSTMPVFYPFETDKNFENLAPGDMVFFVLWHSGALASECSLVGANLTYQKGV